MEEQKPAYQPICEVGSVCEADIGGWDHDVTKEILEEHDVTKEILEEQKERSHTDPTTTLVWVGLWQSLTGSNPTHC